MISYECKTVRVVINLYSMFLQISNSHLIMSVQRSGGGSPGPGTGSDLPSYYRHPDRGLVIEHENEPMLEETVRKRAARQKNADKRFNSPFGFHEPKYKKVGLIERYPLAFRRTLVTTCLLLFFR